MNCSISKYSSVFHSAKPNVPIQISENIWKFLVPCFRKYMEVSLVLSGHTNCFWGGTASYIFNRKWFRVAEDSKIVNKGKELSLQNKSSFGHLKIGWHAIVERAHCWKSEIAF